MALSLPMAAAGIAAVSITGLTGLLLLISGAGQSTTHTGLLSGSVCATSGPIAGISDASAANGRIVAAVSVARGGDQAALIALMTGLTESGLRVLANPHDPLGTPTPTTGSALTRTPSGSPSSGQAGALRLNAWNQSPRPTSSWTGCCHCPTGKPYLPGKQHCRFRHPRSRADPTTARTWTRRTAS
jgi:hypothetical protein